MNLNNASEKSAADQVIQIPLEHNAHHDLQQAGRDFRSPHWLFLSKKNGSTLSIQRQDRNVNEQNRSLDAIDQIAHIEEVIKKGLRIWNFAGLQPRIIHVANYNNTWPENIYFCPSMPQQCPLTLTCIESREVVLKFKKPLQGLVLRSKTYMEDAERRVPYTPGTEYDTRMFGQVEAEMLRRDEPIIYANLDIDLIWPHTGESWTGMVHPLGGVYRNPVMKQIILSKNKHNYPARVPGIMPRLVDNRSLAVYQWAKFLNAQELYFLQEDDGYFSIIEESTQISHLCDGFVSEASLNQLVWGEYEMRGSSENIQEAHKKGFNDPRNFMIGCFQQGLVESGCLDDEDQRELQRLLAWEPPKIKYIQESQIEDIL